MRSSKWIDDQGFLHRTFEVVDGCEEETGHCPPRSTKFHKIMRVRQVPGDGSCLFHSITASLSLAVNGTHHPMELLPLRWHSNYLRQLAVDVFEQESKRVLWLQGPERMTAAELLEAVAEQYSVAPEQYCRQMRKHREWGGGPEIVVLANVLKRPIHVYELHAVCEELEPPSDSGPDSGLQGVLPAVRAFNPRPAGQAKMVWKLRRIACFGSPKFDRCHEALHILSADSRFPDLRPGDHLPNGNHFLALFPCDETKKDEPHPALRKGQTRGGATPRESTQDHPGRRWPPWPRGWPRPSPSKAGDADEPNKSGLGGSLGGFMKRLIGAVLGAVF